MKFPLLRCLLAAGLVFAMASGCAPPNAATRKTYYCNSVDTAGFHVCSQYNNYTSAPPCSGTPVSECTTSDLLGRCAEGGGTTVVWFYSTGGKTAAAAEAVCLQSGSWTSG
jgi:hypothetical protein